MSVCKMDKFPNKNWFAVFFSLFLSGIFFVGTTYAGTLSCTVRATTCVGGETNVFEMSATANAHAAIPTTGYGQLVCCTGVTGLSNLCSGTFATVAKLSGTTNAHIQQTGSYANSVCISVPSGGSVSIGYQATNCSSPTIYDTTLASMKTTDNSHVGDTTAYTEYKICGTAAGAAAQTLTFSISDNTIEFGTLSSSDDFFADNVGGNATEVEAHTLIASTNATNGYVITIKGATLTHTNPSFSITAIGGTNSSSSPGNEQFGLRMTATGGSGTVTSPYADTGFAYAGTATTTSQVASASSGDGATTTYSVRYLANIAAQTEAGAYSTALTYVATANF